MSQEQYHPVFRGPGPELWLVKGGLDGLLPTDWLGQDRTEPSGFFSTVPSCPDLVALFPKQIQDTPDASSYRLGMAR